MAVYISKVMVYYNLIQRSLKSGSAQVQILFAACWWFAMAKISDNGSGWT